MEFHGVKVALLVGDKLLLYQRDDLPGLFNANMWDFPGGGRESDESPRACAKREVREEFELELMDDDFIWEKVYPAQKDPNQAAYFMVARVDEKRLENITLHEGQKWQLMTKEEFFSRNDVVIALKDRFQDFLDETSG